MPEAHKQQLRRIPLAKMATAATLAALTATTCGRQQPRLVDVPDRRAAEHSCGDDPREGLHQPAATKQPLKQVAAKLLHQAC